MLKIGTLSVNVNTDDLNHGAVLHSWAFQRYLQKTYECDVEIIDYTTPNLYGKDLKHPVSSLIQQKKYRSALVALASAGSYKKRYDKFQKFKNEHMKMSTVRYSRDSLNHADLKYDIVICESDVIWTPNKRFGGDFDPTFFLALDSMKDKKRIAYAPSMGNLTFTQEETARFKDLIKNVDSVSCREEYASDFVRDTCGIPVETVVDPVLLLDAEDYKGIEAERLIKEPYLLLYAPLEYNLDFIKFADRYGKEHGLKVVELSRYAFDSVFHKTISYAGIGEFLSLIKHADMIFCNSFHGVCFSVIYQKQFFAFGRPSGRKYEEFCGRLGLQDRFMRSVDKDTILDNSDIDYHEVSERLNEMIRVSKDYLQRTIMEEVLR